MECYKAMRTTIACDYMDESYFKAQKGTDKLCCYKSDFPCGEGQQFLEGSKAVGERGKSWEEGRRPLACWNSPVS